MTRDERTALEVRLADALQAVARLVPDEAPPRRAPVHEPRVVTRYEQRRGADDDGPPPVVPSTPRPEDRRDRRRVVLTIAAVLVAVCMIGALALVLASRSSSSSPVHIGVGSHGSAATTAPATTTVPAGMVTVPNVVGKTQAEASQILVNTGLTTVTQNVMSAQPAGTVVGQNPMSGSVPSGSSVTISVSG